MFSFRYSWLKKPFDAAREIEGDGNTHPTFTGEDAITQFDIEKNKLVTADCHRKSYKRILTDPRVRYHVNIQM